MTQDASHFGLPLAVFARAVCKITATMFVVGVLIHLGSPLLVTALEHAVHTVTGIQRSQQLCLVPFILLLPGYHALHQKYDISSTLRLQ